LSIEQPKNSEKEITEIDNDEYVCGRKKLIEENVKLVDENQRLIELIQAIKKKYEELQEEIDEKIFEFTEICVR